jgi:hypothetical protein
MAKRVRIVQWVVRAIVWSAHERVKNDPSYARTANGISIGTPRATARLLGHHAPSVALMARAVSTT